MNDYYDEIILDMDEHIHWSPREADNFLPDHKDINTFIIINETPDKQIDYINMTYDGKINKFDNIFTADIINEYVSKNSHILHVYGTIGYSADTEEVEFIYDKKENIIYVYGNYRLLSCDFECELFKDTYNISYDKYWTVEKDRPLIKLIELTHNKEYEIDNECIPYYRYPRTKDGLSIPRIIYNVFKIFSNPDVSKEDKPKIIIPNFFCI